MTVAPETAGEMEPLTVNELPFATDVGDTAQLMVVGTISSAVTVNAAAELVAPS